MIRAIVYTLAAVVVVGLFYYGFFYKPDPETPVVVREIEALIEGAAFEAALARCDWLARREPANPIVVLLEARCREERLRKIPEVRREIERKRKDLAGAGKELPGHIRDHETRSLKKLEQRLEGWSRIDEAAEGQRIKTLYDQALALDPEGAGTHLKIGDNHRRMNRVAEAIASFRKTIQLAAEKQLRRTLIDGHRHLADVLLARRNLDEAEKHYRACLAEVATLRKEEGRKGRAAWNEESEAEARRMAAYCHWSLGEVARARNRFAEEIDHRRRAVKLEETNASYRSSLASAYMRTGAWGRAVEHLNYVARDPRRRSADVLAALATCWMNLYNNLRALRYLEEALSRNWPDVENLVRKSPVWRRFRDLPEVLRRLGWLVSEKRLRFTLVRIARMAAAEERYEPALEEALKLAGEHPRLAPARLLVGYCYLGMWKRLQQLEVRRRTLAGAIAKAAKAEDALVLERLTRARRDVVEAITRLQQSVFLHSKKTLVAWARPYFEQALKLEPGVRMALAAAYYFDKADLHDVAARYARRAVEAGSGRRMLAAYARFHLGYCLERTGKLHQALAEYDRAVALDPGHVYYHLSRARVLKGMNDYRAALAGFETARKLQALEAPQLVPYGEVLERLGKLDGALAAYRRYKDFRPDRPLGYYRVGRVLARQGIRGEAARNLQLAAEADRDRALAFHRADADVWKGIPFPR